MKSGILKEGDYVQTNNDYQKKFSKTVKGVVTSIIPDELGELVFVDHNGFDVGWLKKATNPCKTCPLGIDGVCVEAEP